MDFKREKNQKFSSKKHNQKLESIIKASPIGIGLVIDRVLQEVNQTFYQMVGYDEKEVLVQSSRFLYSSQEEFDGVGKEKYQQISQNGIGTVQTKWRNKDGSIIDVILSSSPLNPNNISDGVTFTALDITEKKKAEDALTESEAKYRLIAENTADTITIMDLNLKSIYISPSITKLQGYTVEEAFQLELAQLLTPSSLQKVYSIYEEEKNVEYSGKADPSRSRLLELKAKRKDGSTIWIETKVSYIRDDRQNPIAILTVSRDISKRKKDEKEILRQKAQFEALFTNTNDAMVFFDTQENILNINYQFTKMFGYELDEVKGRYVNSVVDPLGKLSEYGSPKTLRGETLGMETVRYNMMGQAIQVSIKGGPVYIDGEITGGYAVFADITERKRQEAELRYLSLHDNLTTLYNRAYFEEELRRLGGSREYPITIISVDVDGLKLINDTIGHDSGDELLRACARILKQSLRGSDILARMGGDEFNILLSRTDEQTGEKLINRIRTKVDEYNSEHLQLPLSISIGLATAEEEGKSLEEVFKKADDAMYRSKLNKSTSTKSKIIDTLMNALGERDYITEGHAKRLTGLCKTVGQVIGLSMSELDNITLLAQVHDLGKVGIPDSILFKNGKLTDEEWEVMRQHPEKGYRIASSSPDFVGIADLILKHHERWDGKGYPLGLKGQDIPIECRILSIADAFDAMTNDRPYSRAKTVEEALTELRRCSGTQFDPKLVGIFISIF